MSASGRPGYDVNLTRRRHVSRRGIAQGLSIEVDQSEGVGTGGPIEVAPSLNQELGEGIEKRLFGLPLHPEELPALVHLEENDPVVRGNDQV